MREKPYTVKEFFEKVKEKICNEGNWPDGILSGYLFGWIHR